ncbi:MAG TPA: DUF3592 domain-containing protein [Tepidisphaeraceae bacterium]|jgi:hypothetical protein
MNPDTELPPTLPRRVGGRTWLELPVRPWLVLAVLMTLVAIALAAHRYSGTMQQRRLVESGTSVVATVKTIGLVSERQASRDEPRRVRLVYTDPASGREISSEGMLSRKERSRVELGQKFNVRIDAADPDRWTDRTEPSPLSAELAVPMLMLPVAAVCWAAAWLKKRRVARAARAGGLHTARVVSVRQSPLAPMSKQIGVVLDGPDRVVRPLYWPAKFGPVHPDDQIDVIAGPRGPVLAARAYGG